MSRTLAPLVCLVAAAAVTATAAQSDLDALMRDVMTRRDGNWKKLQQYVLEERETMDVTAFGGRRVYGYRREYQWFPRDGVFVKSPLTADGVAIDDAERRRQEARWLARERAREERRQSRQTADAGEPARAQIGIGPGGVEAGVEAALRDTFEPGFVSAAYFLDFKFEDGQYALVARDTYEGRNVLQVEYYPTRMFTRGRTRPNRALRERNQEITRQMNKVSQVTLWIDPVDRQIVKYDFQNVDPDFFPAGWLLRLDSLHASMEMGQPFEDVWLPRRISVGFDMSLAAGTVQGRYASEYYDYRLATVTERIR